MSILFYLFNFLPLKILNEWNNFSSPPLNLPNNESEEILYSNFIFFLFHFFFPSPKQAIRDKLYKGDTQVHIGDFSKMIKFGYKSN